MITVDIIGIENSVGTLRLMGNALGDLKPFLQEAGEYMVESIRENFNAGGRPDAWQQLTNGQPSHLRMTGSLFSTIAILERTEDSVVIGSNSSYQQGVRELQQGFNIAGTKERWRALFANLIRLGRYTEDYIGRSDKRIINPPRQFIMFQMQQGGDVDHIVDLLNKHINKTTKG